MRFNPRGNGAAHSSLSSYKILRRGDIAFEGNRHRVHPFGQLVINDISDGLMSSRFQSIRPKAPCVIPFWKYLLQNERGMRHLLIRSTKSGTLMNEFVFDDFSRQSIPLPEEREQEKIGTLFKLLDSIIAAEKRKLDLLQKKKTTLLLRVFGQKLRFKGYSDFWEQHKLGRLGISYSGLSGKNKTDFGHGLASYITYMNVFQNPIADIDSNDQIEIDAKQHTVRYGDALFTISSETPEEVGMSSVWLGNQKNVYLNSFCFGYRQDGSFDALYLAYMLRSEAVRNQMRMLAQGISRFNISQHKVMDINVVLPSISEQQKIGSFCRGLDQLISTEMKKIDLLTLKKKALLQQMFV